MKHRDLSYLPGTPAFGAPESLGAVIILSRKTRRSRLLVVLALAVMTLGILIPSYGQGTNVFNCSSGFASSGSCGTTFSSGSENFTLIGTTSGSTPQLSNSQVLLLQSGVQHTALSLNYKAAKVNDQAFTTTFEFIPNGWTLSLELNNTSDSYYGFNGSSFAQGAGCEADWYQGFSPQTTPINYTWALDLSSYDSLTNGGGFTYSSVQIYQPGQDPCLPNDGSPNWYATNKISTFPVPLTSPVNQINSYTGDTYSVTVVYTGTTVTYYMYDVTAGGTCSPITSSTCTTYTWTGVQIPSIVGSTTAWVGLGGSVASVTPTANEYIVGWSYSTLSAATTPTFSPAAGTYAGTQSVTISDSSSGSIICYNTTGAPATNGVAGCANGTLYTGAISVTSGQTIYAVAGGSGHGDSPIGSNAYSIAGTASQPTFSLGTAKYQGVQTLTISDATPSSTIYYTTDGSTPTTSSSVYSAPITVSATQTVNAIATASAVAQSAIGSVTLTINPYAGAAPANSPTYLPVPGTYSSAQSVTLSSTTSSSYICYVLSATPPTLMPQPNNVGGCTTGTLYSGPISVSSSQTIYAMAGTPRLGPPSSLAVGAYAIGGTQAPGTPTNPKANAVPQ